MISSAEKYYDLIIAASIAILSNILLFGCSGVGKAPIMKSLDINKDYSFVTISEGTSPVYVPLEVKNLFREKLDNLLYERGTFKRGTTLKIVYSYIHFNPGHQATHYLIRGGFGEGSIALYVRYTDDSGNEIANMQTSGKIRLGYPIDKVLEDCARQVISYTEAKFLNRTETFVDTKGDNRKTTEKETGNDRMNGREKMKGWWEPVR